MNNLDASDVASISVRVRIAAHDNTTLNNDFVIYYSKVGSSYQEGQTLLVSYTTNGEWMELVFDPKASTNWNGTINGIRLDPIQSGRDDVKNKSFTFEIDWIQINKKDSTSDHRNGGYYPFSDISNSVPGRADQFDLNTWKQKVEAGSTGTEFASRALFNTTKATTKQEHLAFGTVIEQQFYIPASHQTDFGEDILYTFTGDDDLWVFVDGQLVLDIGGGHTPVTGTVNFTKKTNQVNSAIQVTGYDAPTSEVNPQQQNGTLADALCAPGVHTLKIFYMERHSGVSNCLMKFNLPLVPEGSVAVSKTVQDVTTGAAIEDLMNTEFTFKISGTTTNTGVDANLDVSDLSYTVLDTASGKSTTQKTNAGGTFTLKHGQTAYFNIAENYDVTVEEIEPTANDVTSYGYVSTKLTVDGTVNSGWSATVHTAKGSKHQYDFLNLYKPQYGAIKISKTGWKAIDENQTFIFRVTNQAEGIDMTVTIVGNGSSIIQNVPVGTYTITELTDWSWRYEPTAKIQTVTVKGGETAETAPEAKFENKRQEDKWLSGDCTAKNWWGKFDKNADAAAVK